MTSDELKAYRREWMRRFRATPEGKAATRKWNQKYQAAHRGQSTEPARRHKAKWSVARKVWQSAKQRAARVGLPFELTVADVHVPEICPYLNVPIEPGHVFNGPSLDRIDSTKGYTPDNVVVVSRRANSIKNDATPDELEQIAQAVRFILGSK